nr:hypothetical protein [Candidatus Protochlamydia amoebophila]
MVDTFYCHLLGMEVEKLNKAQALQKAMLMAIEQKREKTHVWGAFFYRNYVNKLRKIFTVFSQKFCNLRNYFISFLNKIRLIFA